MASNADHKPKLAAIYARVSTEEQALTSGVPSTETQVDRCRAMAATLGIPVSPDESKHVVEETHSGADLRWVGTKFMDLVRRAQRGEFTDLICLDIDRFCRAGVNAYFQQEGFFNDAGVTIHYVMDDIPQDMPMRGTVIAARADAAHWWKTKVREASMRVRNGNAERGEFIPGHAPPFGFEWVEDPIRKTRKDKPLKIGLRPHPQYAPILLHMYEHIAGRGSVWTLAHWLDGENIPTPRGAATWTPSCIRRILHNPTNWGERRTFMTKETPRAEGVHRAATMKTATWHRPTAEDEQITPKLAIFEPIPGLTRDLAMRALAQLGENEQNARRRATHTEEELAERGLLFNGWVRCGVCRRGLKMKRTGPRRSDWMYHCAHEGTVFSGVPQVTLLTATLDALVWRMAVRAIRDPNFFDQLLRKTDEMAGALARAASLERQLTDATRERDYLRKHLRRLDPDDPENTRVLAGIDADLRKAEDQVADLIAQLDATRAQAAREQERRASVEAFHAYAAEQRPTLDQKTPLERRQMLATLHTRVRLHKVAGKATVSINFDVRTLTGSAADALALFALHGQRAWANRNPSSAVARVLVTVRHGVEWLDQGFSSEEEFDAYVEQEVARQEQEGARYQQWLDDTGRTGGPDDYAAYFEWKDREGAELPQADDASAVGDTMSAEPSVTPLDGASAATLAARRGSARPPAPVPRPGTPADRQSARPRAPSSRRRGADTTGL